MNRDLIIASVLLVICCVLLGVSFLGSPSTPGDSTDPQLAQHKKEPGTSKKRGFAADDDPFSRPVNPGIPLDSSDGPNEANPFDKEVASVVPAGAREGIPLKNVPGEHETGPMEEPALAKNDANPGNDNIFHGNHFQNTGRIGQSEDSDPGHRGTTEVAGDAGEPDFATPIREISPVGSYTVKKGDTLGKISLDRLGSSRHWQKIEAANPGIDPDNLKPGQVLTLPAIDSSAVAGSVTETADGRKYTVKRGDNYYVIAQRQLGDANRWRELERLNNIDAYELRVGMVISLPERSSSTGSRGSTERSAASGTRTHTVREGEYLSDIAVEHYGSSRYWRHIKRANPGLDERKLKVGQVLTLPNIDTSRDDNSSAGPGRSYTVKSGDTLQTIAKRFYGGYSKWKDIKKVNPGIDPQNLKVGQRISLPKLASTAGGGSSESSSDTTGSPFP